MESHTKKEIQEQCKLLLGINDSKLSIKEKTLMIYFHEKILKKQEKNPFNIKSCIICLEKLIDRNIVTFTCYHKFCVNCIKKYKNDNCPVCKKKMVHFIEIYFTEKMYDHVIMNYLEMENVKIIKDLIKIFSRKGGNSKKKLFFSEYIYYGRFSMNLLI
jgi:hypothetical protein